jgi:hypothetical protein
VFDRHDSKFLYKFLTERILDSQTRSIKRVTVLL